MTAVTRAGPRAGEARETGKSGRRLSLSRLTPVLLLAPSLLTVAGLVIAPLVVVVRDSFAQANPYGGITGGFTTSNFSQVFSGVYLGVISHSLEVAAINTVICVTAGYLVSHYIVSRPPHRQSLILMLIIVPFWTDFLVRTFALINVLEAHGPLNAVTNAIGLTHGALSLIPSQGAAYLGLLYAFLPTAVFPIYASMRGIDPSVREAAQDLGCGWWRVHARVIAPLSRPGIYSAVLLVFVPTLGVFVIPVLLDGGLHLLIGNLIVTLYTEFRNQPLGAAFSVVLLALMLLAGAVFGLLSRRVARRSSARRSSTRRSS
jgi:spermidine/putrescine transport system permease protein